MVASERHEPLGKLILGIGALLMSLMRHSKEFHSTCEAPVDYLDRCEPRIGKASNLEGSAQVEIGIDRLSQSLFSRNLADNILGNGALEWSRTPQSTITLCKVYKFDSPHRLKPCVSLGQVLGHLNGSDPVPDAVWTVVMLRVQIPKVRHSTRRPHDVIPKLLRLKLALFCCGWQENPVQVQYEYGGLWSLNSLNIRPKPAVPTGNSTETDKRQSSCWNVTVLVGSFLLQLYLLLSFLFRHLESDILDDGEGLMPRPIFPQTWTAKFDRT